MACKWCLFATVWCNGYLTDLNGWLARILTDGLQIVFYLMVDRGNGFYQQTTGDVTPTYKSVLRECGLKNFMGDNCGLQPGQLGDVLLHETAVAWVRRRERKTVPAPAWAETREAFGQRLKGIAQDFNNRYDVESLCRGFPKRVQQLVDGNGKKLRT